VSVIDLIMPALPFPAASSATPEPAEAPALLLAGPRAFWLATARRFVCDALVGADLSVDTLEQVLLALEEVVVEALRQNGTRSVTVEAWVESETVEVVVRERGATSGFDAAGLTGLDRHAHEWGVTRRRGSSHAWFTVQRGVHVRLIAVP
jgi:hypothetical protein